MPFDSTTHSPSRRLLHLDIVAVVIALYVIELVVVLVLAPLYRAPGWQSSIASETIFIVTALVASTFLPRAITPRVGADSVADGLLLGWPMLAMSTWFIVIVLRDTAGAPIAAPLIMALAVGFAEELQFRVVLLGWLAGRLAPAAAVAVSAMIFGAAHMLGHAQPFSIVSIAAVIPQTALGFVLGGIYLRTRNPLPCMLLHAAWDLPFFIYQGAAVAGGAPGRSLPTFVALLPWLAFMVYGIWLVRYAVARTHRIALT